MSGLDLYLPADTCPVCGFRPRGVLPHDALRTLRVLPRQWRETIGVFGAHEAGEELIRHPLGAGPSAVGHALLVADAFDRAAEQLHAIRSADRPNLDDLGATRPRAGWDELATDLILNIQAAEADRLAAEAQRFHGHDWVRTGSRTTREVTALEVLRRAVHEGVHRLDETSRGLARLRATEAAAA